MTTTDEDTSKPAPTPNWKLFFSQGLEGYDETWELLIPLFEQLQPVCADVANPTLDVLTFAHTAHYFSVLHVEKIADEDEKSGNEEDSSLDTCRGNTSARTQGVSFSDYSNDFGNEALGSSNQWAPTVNPQAKTPIGLLYLHSSQNVDDYLRSGELNVGVFIDEKHRGRGYGRQAIQKALQVAFEDQNCHRVQAVLVDSPYKDQALSLFMMSGMGHEGVRRRGFRSPWDFEFKDVTYLGLLATDWFIRDQALFKNKTKWTPAVKSLWDEMFARHQREREELLRMEDRKMSGNGKLKRTSSMETIKQVATSTINALSDYTDDDMYDESESVEDDDSESVRPGSVASSSSSSAFSVVSAQSPHKRRRTSRETDGTSGSWSSRGGSLPPSSNGSEADDYVFDDDEEVASSPLSNLIAAPERHIPEGLMNWLTESSTRAVGVDVSEPHRGHSPTLSEDSDLTEISDGYATSTSSRWDVIERGSTPGLSDLDDDDAANM
ncbi:hypothetical protein H1R20_g12004, partial [Candolleomyces eurysporus]